MHGVLFDWCWSADWLSNTWLCLVSGLSSVVTVTATPAASSGRQTASTTTPRTRPAIQSLSSALRSDNTPASSARTPWTVREWLGGRCGESLPLAVCSWLDSITIAPVWAWTWGPTVTSSVLLPTPSSTDIEEHDSDASAGCSYRTRTDNYNYRKRLSSFPTQTFWNKIEKLYEKAINFILQLEEKKWIFLFLLQCWGKKSLLSWSLLQHVDSWGVTDIEETGRPDREGGGKERRERLFLLIFSAEDIAVSQRYHEDWNDVCSSLMGKKCYR